MNHVISKSVTLVLALSGTFTMSQNAQASGRYVLQKSVIAGGGGPVSGGTYQLTGTIGQGTIAVRAAGQYVLFDGFWGPVGSVDFDLIFADGFEGL